MQEQHHDEDSLADDQKRLALEAWQKDYREERADTAEQSEELRCHVGRNLEASRIFIDNRHESIRVHVEQVDRSHLV